MLNPFEQALGLEIVLKKEGESRSKTEDVTKLTIRSSYNVFPLTVCTNLVSFKELCAKDITRFV